jgi:hypothetical protein
MTIKTSNVPELVGSGPGQIVQFVASHDAKELILRLRNQSRLTDDEILALAIVVGEAALAKYVDPSQGETCDQAISDVLSVLDHEAVVLALRRKVRELLEQIPAGKVDSPGLP